MSTAKTEQEEQEKEQSAKNGSLFHYHIRYRKEGREITVQSRLDDLTPGTVVMVRTDHGPEPAVIVSKSPELPLSRSGGQDGLPLVTRPATREEEEKYARLPLLEQEAFAICQERIDYLRLPMNLVRVERFFNGSKIIFYFTAESRVDFRELVKNLVQEFRTRVEMRQIGVRHETQMTGGIGACGRELCCSSFLKKFDSVSIKMAKMQDLPLNPAKISGVCNRLLCCLTYEHDVYQRIRAEMPRIGRQIRYQGQVYRVVRHLPLQEKILVSSRETGELVLDREEWQAARVVGQGSGKQKGQEGREKKSGPKKGPENRNKAQDKQK